jgi:ABC-type Na+ efflux pump permease subunit
VLLAAFLATLAVVAGGGAQLSWLIYAPPFTPFIMLLTAPGRLPAFAEWGSIGLLLAASALAARMAVTRLTLTGGVERPAIAAKS